MSSTAASRTVSRTRSRRGRPPKVRRGFGEPIRDDVPAASTIAEIMKPLAPTSAPLLHETTRRCLLPTTRRPRHTPLRPSPPPLDAPPLQQPPPLPPNPRPTPL